jgi:hypothetical protein
MKGHCVGRFLICNHHHLDILSRLRVCFLICWQQEEPFPSVQDSFTYLFLGKCGCESRHIVLAPDLWYSCGKGDLKPEYWRPISESQVTVTDMAWDYKYLYWVSLPLAKEDKCICLWQMAKLPWYIPIHPGALP